MKEKITKQTILSTIIKKPGAKEILKKYHLPCLICPLAKQEIENLTLGQVSQIYNLDLKGLLKELNQL